MNKIKERSDVRLDSRIAAAVRDWYFDKRIAIFDKETGRDIGIMTASHQEVMDELINNIIKAVQDYVDYKIKKAEELNKK